MANSENETERIKALEARVLELERFVQMLRNSLLSNWHDERTRVVRAHSKPDNANYNIAVLTRTPLPNQPK